MRHHGRQVQRVVHREEQLKLYENPDFQLAASLAQTLCTVRGVVQGSPLGVEIDVSTSGSD